MTTEDVMKALFSSIVDRSARQARPRNDMYASYCVVVVMENFNKIDSPEVWSISSFFHPFYGSHKKNVGDSCADHHAQCWNVLYILVERAWTMNKIQ